MKAIGIHASIRIATILIAVLLTAVLAASGQVSAGANSPAAAATASVPHLVRLSGTVRDEAGKPQTGVVGVTFALYKDQDGGAPLWLETQNVQADANGHYAVMLGAATSEGLPMEFFTSNEARWVGVRPQGQEEEPRILLVSAPYALKAADAETLGGKPASAFVTMDSQSALLSANRNAAASTSAIVPGAAPGAAGKSSANPASPCSVTTDGNATVNSVAKFLSHCEVVKSSISESGGSVTLGGVGILNLPQTTGSAGILKIGTSSFLHACCSSSADNSFVGTNAGNFTSSGNQNTAAGFNALHAVTTGSENTATGFEALSSNTNGNSNTADGHEALISNTSGFNNTASGFSALLSNGTGHDNTASGDSALAGNTSGSFNTASGESALSSNTTGSFNTAFGYAAQVASGNLTNATAIGAHATVGASNALVLGGTGSNAVKVGIGTTIPSATLDAEDTTNATAGVLGAPTAGVVGSAFSSSGLTRGVFGQVSSSTTSAAGVVGEANATSGQTYGVSGFNSSNSNFAAGVEAVSDGSSGKTFGLVAASNSLNGTGVFSLAISRSNTASGLGCCPVGVWGDTGSNAPGAAGLVGTADDGRAIFLQNNSPSGVPVEVAFNTENTVHFLPAFQTGGSFGSCTVDTDGNLTCSGAKHAVVRVSNGRQVSLSAVESPENWFEDFGSGRLSNGDATVTLESTFAETVNTGMEYHVFLTPKGDCKGLYIANETAGKFEVRELGGGQSDVAFDYRIVARRKGYEKIRLEDMTDRLKSVQTLPMPKATPGQRLTLPGPVIPAVPKHEAGPALSASR